MNCEVINTRLGDIEYSLKGKGFQIVFIHGGHSNCHDKLCHKGFDLELFQLITPSRPGYGKTPLNDNLTPKKAADLIIELLNHLGLENVIVYGVSAGGLTAIELASNYPHRVSKLILASAITKKWLDENNMIYRMAHKIFNPKIEKFTWATVIFFSKIFPNVIGKSFYTQFSKNQRGQLKISDLKELVSTIKNYRSGHGFLNDLDHTISDSRITEIKCPTLIVHSMNDNSVPFEHASNAEKKIENSKLVALNNEWGHMFWIGTDSLNSIKKTIDFIYE